MSKKVKDYTLHEEIGKGTYGTVYRATRDNDLLTYACKTIATAKLRSEKERELLKQEITTHQKLDHPNIVRMYYNVSTANNYYLFMEYCKGGDLQGKLNEVKRFPETEALYYLKQIMSGLKYLVDRGIMHRDIKPQNFLLSEDQLKLADFGFAKEAESTATNLGSPLYMAPEILRHHERYDNKVDIWSVGCIYYQMLFGEHPFLSVSPQQLLTKIQEHERRGKFTFPAQIPVSELSKDLLNKMLTVDPQKRCSWDEVFNHPVFSEKEASGPIDMMASTYRYHQEEVDQQFQADRLNKTPAASDLMNIMEEDSHLDSQYSSRSKENSVAGSEVIQNKESLYIQDATTFAPSKLYIHPNLVETYTKNVVSHEKQMIRYIIECCKRCIKTASQLSKEGASLQVDQTLVLGLRNSLIGTCLSGVGIVRAITAKTILAFGPNRQVYNEYKLPPSSQSPQAQDKLCSLIYQQALHDQTGLYAKIQDNCLKSTVNLLGTQFLSHPEVVKVYNRIVKIHQDSLSNPEPQLKIYESYTEVHAIFVSQVTAVAQHFLGIKDYTRGDLRKQLASTMSFIAFSSGFLFLDQDNYKQIAQNNFKFLNPTFMMRGPDGLHFQEFACFNWTEFSNKSMSVEAMTESVKQLYKGLGLQAENSGLQIRTTMFEAKNTLHTSEGPQIQSSPTQTSIQNSFFPRASAFDVGEQLSPQSNFGYNSYQPTQLQQLSPNYATPPQPEYQHYQNHHQQYQQPAPIDDEDELF